MRYDTNYKFLNSEFGVRGCCGSCFFPPAAEVFLPLITICPFFSYLIPLSFLMAQRGVGESKKQIFAAVTNGLVSLKP